MERIDKRKKAKSMMQSHMIFAGYKIDTKAVEEMLQFMGVHPTEVLVQEAIGFFSAHAMEMNMTNLYSFIKEKGLDKNRIDMRVKKN